MDKRKQLAATLGLFAVLFLAVGAVAATGPGTVVIHVFVVVALVVAVLLALMGWGVLRSVRADAAETRLDTAIEQAVAASPQRFGQLCDCGHEHDPTELHITDAEPTEADSIAAGPIAAGPTAAGPTAEDDAHATCEHDGAGAACARDCSTCLFATARRPTAEDGLRPSPTRTRAERANAGG